MGYRIEYDTDTKYYEITPESKPRQSILTGISFGIFLAATFLFWPEGAQFLQEVLIPGDNAVTLKAFEALAENFAAGMGLREAAEAFCTEILSGA